MSRKLGICLAIVLAMTFQSYLVAASQGDDGPAVSTGGTGPRAQLVNWTDTDWSGGTVNASSDVELNLTPGEAVLASDPSNMVSLYTVTAENIPSMVEFKGNLVLAASSGVSGTDIYSCDLVTLACLKVAHLNETTVRDMTVSDNGSRLYISGSGPISPPPYGSVYFFNGTFVTRHEVKDALTHSLYVSGALELSGKIYAISTDNDNRAYVYRSLDDGASWIKVNNLGAKPYPRNLYALTKIGNTIYAQTDGLAPEGPRVIRYNGTAWASDPVPGMVNTQGTFTEVNGTVYMTSGGFVFAFKNWTWVQVPSPTSPLVSELETYDTGTKTFTQVGDLVQSRRYHTSDLTSGNVITVGGFVGETIVGSAEAYNVTTGKSTLVKSMATSRAYHASAVLNDGKVIVAGGLTGLPPAYTPTNTVEIYNPSTDTWATTLNSLSVARSNLTLTKLNDGRVLAVGGNSGPTTEVTTAEIYSSGSGLWAAVAPMNFARSNHSAVLLQNGSVLVCGGGSGGGVPLSKAEVYSSSANKWYILPDIPTYGFGRAASLMDDGNVLVSGVWDSVVLDTSTNTWTTQVNMINRGNHTSTAVTGGVVVIGGQTDHPWDSTADIYSYASSTWASATGQMDRGRTFHRAVKLNSTTILVVGGQGAYSPSIEAAIAYGKDGFIVANSDRAGNANKYYLCDDRTGWSAPMSITGNPQIYDMQVVHGRLLASTQTAGLTQTVYTAKPSWSGTFVSKPHDLGGYATGATLSWSGLLPTGTAVKFQVRSARSQQDLASENFTGPDGTTSTYFTTTNTALNATQVGDNWFQYKAYLDTSDQTVSPILQSVSLVATVEPLTIKTITVLPAEASITADQYVKFNATGFDQFGTEMAITPVWSATGGTIGAATGNYTPKLSGSWKVHATALGKDGSANVTVSPGVLIAIKVSPDKWLGTTDETKEFIAQGFDAKANIVQFTPSWALSGGGKITPAGNFSPTMPGTWTIFANDTVTGQSGNTTAIISLGVPASVIISPSTVQLKAGDSQKFTASVYDLDGNQLNFPVEWRTPGGGILTPQGNYTARRTGTWSVYANLSEYHLSASATVTIKPGPLAKIEVGPDGPIVRAGRTLNLTARPLDAFDNIVDVTIQWAVTGGGPIDSSQYSPTRAGVYTVYANASGLTGMTVVHVLPGPLFKFTVTPADINLTTGNWIQFSALGEDQYGNVISGLGIQWSAQAGLGTIDNTGAFTAGKIKMSGQVTASATYANSTLSTTAHVSVTSPKEPVKEVVPAYYGYMRFVIVAVLIAVAALILVELTRKNSPTDK